jgi:hypothetical protein
VSASAPVYLCVAPPDGFEAWSEKEWDEWLEDHPWEPAERVASRSDWSMFLYQLREFSPKTAPKLAAYMERLITEKPINTKDTKDFRDYLREARDEMAAIPAEKMRAKATGFYTPEELDALIAGNRERLGGKEPTAADVWEEVFNTLLRVLDDAAEVERGVYFGEV